MFHGVSFCRFRVGLVTAQSTSGLSGMLDRDGRARHFLKVQEDADHVRLVVSVNGLLQRLRLGEHGTRQAELSAEEFAALM
jgi:hypothetical protein